VAAPMLPAPPEITATLPRRRSTPPSNCLTFCARVYFFFTRVSELAIPSISRLLRSRLSVFETQ
jgi:hypothetical protein